MEQVNVEEALEKFQELLSKTESEIDEVVNELDNPSEDSDKTVLVKKLNRGLDRRTYALMEIAKIKYLNNADVDNTDLDKSSLNDERAVTSNNEQVG